MSGKHAEPVAAVRVRCPWWSGTGSSKGRRASSRSRLDAAPIRDPSPVPQSRPHHPHVPDPEYVSLFRRERP